MQNQQSYAQKSSIRVTHYLLDGNLLRARRSYLGHNHREDAVLQARPDLILVDTAGEGEVAVEFSNGALAHPVAVLLVVGLGDGLLSGSGNIAAACALGFSRVGVVVAFVEFTLSTALDHQGVVVGKFDVDALLGNTGKFAVEVVGIFSLADVKARREGADSGTLGAAGAVDVVVVQKTEERREVSSRGHSSKERHIVGVV